MKKLLLRKSAALLLVCLLAFAAQAPALALEPGRVSLADYGAAGDGVADDTAALTAAMAAVGSVGIVELPRGDYRLSDSVTVPTGITLRFSRGAKLLPDADKTLTINGAVTAGSYAIFGGNGEVAGNPRNEYGYPQWFGARGDGVSDDTAAFRKTISLLRGRVVRVPGAAAGYVLGDLEIEHPVALRGDVSRTRLVPKAGLSSLITVNSDDVTIENFTANLDAAPAGSAAIVLQANAGSYRNRLLLKSLWLERAYCAVRDAGTGQIINTVLDEVIAYQCKGTPYVFERMAGYNTLRHVVADFVGVPGNSEYPGFIMKNTALGTTVLENVDVLGGRGQSGGHGLVFQNCSNLALRRVMADTVAGKGLLFENCVNVVLDNVAASLCYEAGIELVSCSYVTGSLLRLRGRSDVQNAAGVLPTADGMQGLLIRGGGNINIDNILSICNTGDGVAVVEGASNVTLSNVFTYLNKGCGYAENGSGNLVTSLQVYQSLDSAVRQSGATSRIAYLNVCNEDNGEDTAYFGEEFGAYYDRYYQEAAGAFEYDGQ